MKISFLITLLPPREVSSTDLTRNKWNTSLQTHSHRRQVVKVSIKPCLKMIANNQCSMLHICGYGSSQTRLFCEGRGGRPVSASC
ncbi:hypothetical protein B0T26DRAFT_228631 [Lasiosphaeria miniovina]|uniref:Uncharacterized protein n=1 Tax=Lasiosphaeria miniovina TaxID=1954250 RepID=A0AA40AVC5_9PEZI|nr:uncharacterized protein B0T26DRAFT_228631 [Lasiosphaeria miniovina]KAK0722656.1 hypothetical protein B0T26DRAFT_228631 [Lasiosphaeria miniovina]